MMTQEDKYWRTASVLAIITIVYNLLEGIVSVIMGFADETLSLFGFGIDSFVESCESFEKTKRKICQCNCK